MHSGPGCSSKISCLIGQGEGYAGGNTVPCTNASESEIVYGGEEKLQSVIEGAFKVIDADLYVVLSGCTSDIVGDDTGKVTGEFQKLDMPIVYAETGGFKSNNYVSHEVVVNAIIDQYVDKFKSDKKVDKGLVNVFASIPYQDPYWNGNLEEIKRILEEIGLKVNILFGNSSGGVEEWKTIPNAEFNIVVSAWAGLGIAAHLEDKYGTKFIHFPYLPVGGIETSKFLRLVGDFGGLDKFAVEAVITKEEGKYYTYLDTTMDFLLEFKYGLPRSFYAILDASYAVGFSKFLFNELGIIPKRHFIIDDTPERFQNDVREQLENTSETRRSKVDFEVDGGIIQEEIALDERNQRVLILGSAWDREFAKKIGADLLILGVPVTYRLVLSCGYAGYRGGIKVIEDIYDRVLDTYR